MQGAERDKKEECRVRTDPYRKRFDPRRELAGRDRGKAAVQAAVRVVAQAEVQVETQAEVWVAVQAGVRAVGKVQA